jgi:hypothetical protein
MKILKILTIAACPCLLPSIALAQRAGSAAAYSAMAGIESQDYGARVRWDSSKKITHLDRLPLEPPGQPKDFDGVDSGWIGDMAYWQFTVLSIINDNEMLLQRGNNNIIWLTDYSTREFTDDDQVRIVGPIQAGPTKQYTNVAGASTTVRTFRLLTGQAVQDYQAAQDSKAIKSSVEAVANQFIWGENTPIRPDRIPKNQQRKYKTVVAKTLKRFESGEIDPAARNHITADTKTGKVTYNSPEVKEQAIWHLKSLTNPPIKSK